MQRKTHPLKGPFISYLIHMSKVSFMLDAVSPGRGRLGQKWHHCVSHVESAHCLRWDFYFNIDAFAGRRAEQVLLLQTRPFLERPRGQPNDGRQFWFRGSVIVITVHKCNVWRYICVKYWLNFGVFDHNSKIHTLIMTKWHTNHEWQFLSKRSKVNFTVTS